MTKLTEVARVIRSKNAGPYELTLDILLKDAAVYETFRSRGIISRASVAALYGVSANEVMSVIYFDPAHAIKVTMKRRIPSGAPGDTDVYGAQQHMPLVDFEFELGDVPAERG
jgi:hypothetical protein